MEKESKSTFSTFLSGASKGFFNGALMLGLYGVGLVALTLAFPYLPVALHGATAVMGINTLNAAGVTIAVNSLTAMALKGATLAAFGATVTGLFGGIMAVKNEASEAAETQRLGYSPMREARITQAPLVALQPVADRVAHAQENEVALAADTRWRNQVGARPNRIQEILDRNASDKSRAEAIFAEREAARSAEAAQR